MTLQPVIFGHGTEQMMQLIFKSEMTNRPQLAETFHFSVVDKVLEFRKHCTISNSSG
jgi:hypothetical protein